MKYARIPKVNTQQPTFGCWAEHPMLVAGVGQRRLVISFFRRTISGLSRTAWVATLRAGCVVDPDGRMQPVPFASAGDAEEQHWNKGPSTWQPS